MYFQLFTLVLHVFFILYVVDYYNLGINGIAWFNVVYYMLNLIFIVGFMKLSKNQDLKRSIIWGIPGWQEFSEGFGSQAKFCLKGAFNLILKWFSTEVFIFIAAWFDPVSTASHVNMINLLMFLTYFPLSVSLVNAGIVGRYVGQGNIAAAKKYDFWGKIICWTLSLAFIAVLIAYPAIVADIYLAQGQIRIVSISLVPWLIINRVLKTF